MLLNEKIPQGAKDALIAHELENLGLSSLGNPSESPQSVHPNPLKELLTVQKPKMKRNQFGPTRIPKNLSSSQTISSHTAEELTAVSITPLPPDETKKVRSSKTPRK